MLGPRASLEKRMRITRESQGVQGCSRLLGRTVNVALLQWWGRVVCAISDSPGLCWWADDLAPTTAENRRGLKLGRGGASRGRRHVRWHHRKVSAKVQGGTEAGNPGPALPGGPCWGAASLGRTAPCGPRFEVNKFSSMEGPLSDSDVTLRDSPHHGLSWESDFMSVCLSTSPLQLSWPQGEVDTHA